MYCVPKFHRLILDCIVYLFLPRKHLHDHFPFRSSVPFILCPCTYDIKILIILGYIDQSLPAYIWYDSMTCRNPLTPLMSSPRQMPRRMASALTVKRMRPRWNPIPTFLACPTGRLRSSARVNGGGVGKRLMLVMVIGRGRQRQRLDLERLRYIISSWGWRTWIWVVFFMFFSLTGEPTQGRASLWAWMSKWCWIFLNHGPSVCAFWGSRLLETTPKGGEAFHQVTRMGPASGSEIHLRWAHHSVWFSACWKARGPCKEIIRGK